MTKINITIFKAMHALGFYHEQQRPDRDKFVDFDETKIISDCFNAFKLIPILTNKHKSDGKNNVVLRLNNKLFLISLRIRSSINNALRG